MTAIALETPKAFALHGVQAEQASGYDSEHALA